MKSVRLEWVLGNLRQVIRKKYCVTKRNEIYNKPLNVKLPNQWLVFLDLCQKLTTLHLFLCKFLYAKLSIFHFLQMSVKAAK